MKTDIANRFIWYKGEIVNVNDAKINILAPTAQFGLNVFEGIPCYWNDEEKQLYAFRLDDHYDRLLRSARLIQINCPYTKEDFKKALVDVVKANEYDENLSVRQTLFVDGFGSWGSAEPVDMFVAPIPKGKTSSEYNKKGLNCCITYFSDSEVQAVLNATLASLKKKLPEFDVKYWSKYEDGKRICSPFYHKLHIAQLTVMHDLFGDQIYKEYLKIA